MQRALCYCHRLAGSFLTRECKRIASEDTIASGGRANECLDVLENQLVPFKVRDIRRLRRIVHCGQFEIATRDAVRAAWTSMLVGVLMHTKIQQKTVYGMQYQLCKRAYQLAESWGVLVTHSCPSCPALKLRLYLAETAGATQTGAREHTCSCAPGPARNHRRKFRRDTVALRDGCRLIILRETFRRRTGGSLSYPH